MEDEIPPEQHLRRLATHFGTRSYVMMNSQAIPIKFDGVDAKKAVHYASLMSELVHLTKKFLDGEPDTSEGSNDLVTLRLRTLKHEIIAAPDEDFTLVSVHNPNYVEPVKKPEAAAE